MSIRRGRSAAVGWSVFFDAVSATHPILGLPADNSGAGARRGPGPGRREGRSALPTRSGAVQGSEDAAGPAAPVRTLEGERDGDQAAHR
ncbi:hypothetical protein Slala02_33530 [Streptomyces lavendulae subsp. lavendulae]|nr:hypothetical protein Slala01_36760 [Streptomyces lavendulae subsp. lavendulae]GLX27533.1 hypothetical protein Slala02_33530 [Streptomyces lavendulae subsp. lavendulae]